MENIKWCLKQLLPLRYESEYGRVNDDDSVTPQLAIWRMWFGRCFSVRRWELAE